MCAGSGGYCACPGTRARRRRGGAVAGTALTSRPTPSVARPTTSPLTQNLPDPSRRLRLGRPPRQHHRRRHLLRSDLVAPVRPGCRRRHFRLHARCRGARRVPAIASASRAGSIPATSRRRLPSPRSPSSDARRCPNRSGRRSKVSGRARSTVNGWNSRQPFAASTRSTRVICRWPWRRDRRESNSRCRASGVNRCRGTWSMRGFASAASAQRCSTPTTR